MPVRCVLCDRASAGGAWGVTLTGDVEDPSLAHLCPRCQTLSPGDRKTLRDRAMTRMLVEATRRLRDPLERRRAGFGVRAPAQRRPGAS